MRINNDVIPAPCLGRFTIVDFSMYTRHNERNLNEHLDERIPMTNLPIEVRYKLLRGMKEVA